MFYAPLFPVPEINFDHTPRPEREAWRLALAADIEANGLVNPLIVLNHPRPKCPDMWLMVGTNRLWAVRHLGWKHVPAVVTGACPYPNVEVGTWEELQNLFKDGQPYKSAYGIALQNTTPPESGDYPACSRGSKN